MICLFRPSIPSIDSISRDNWELIESFGHLVNYVNKNINTP